MKEDGPHTAQPKRVCLFKGCGRVFLKTIADVEQHLDASLGAYLFHQTRQRRRTGLAVHGGGLIAEDPCVG